MLKWFRNIFRPRDSDRTPESLFKTPEQLQSALARGCFLQFKDALSSNILLPPAELKNKSIYNLRGDLAEEYVAGLNRAAEELLTSPNEEVFRDNREINQPIEELRKLYYHPLADRAKNQEYIKSMQIQVLEVHLEYWENKSARNEKERIGHLNRRIALSNALSKNYADLNIQIRNGRQLQRSRSILEHERLSLKGRTMGRLKKGKSKERSQLIDPKIIGDKIRQTQGEIRQLKNIAHSTDSAALIIDCYKKIAGKYKELALLYSSQLKNIQDGAKNGDVKTLFQKAQEEYKEYGGLAKMLKKNRGQQEGNILVNDINTLYQLNDPEKEIKVLEMLLGIFRHSVSPDDYYHKLEELFKEVDIRSLGLLYENFITGNFSSWVQTSMSLLTSVDAETEQGYAYGLENDINTHDAYKAYGTASTLMAGAVRVCAFTLNEKHGNDNQYEELPAYDFPELELTDYPAQLLGIRPFIQELARFEARVNVEPGQIKHVLIM